MDKQINKIKASIDKAEGETKNLLKMDKKQDKKIEKCEYAEHKMNDRDKKHMKAASMFGKKKAK